MLKRGLLLASLLALGACSQAPAPSAETNDLQVQRISTPGEDSVVDVAAHPGSGAVYALYETRYVNDAVGGWSQDVYLRRYKRDKTVLWQRQLGGSNINSATALATDSSGNVFIGYNNALEKRRGDGSLVWSRTEDVSALTTDGSGNVYVGDDNSGSLSLSKYTAAGSRAWTRSVEGRGISTRPLGLAADPGGNVYVAASDLDDCCLWNRLLKYNPGGRQLLDQEIRAGSGSVELTSVAVSGNALYLAGNLHSNWDASEDAPDRVDGLLVKLSLGGVEERRVVFGTPETDEVSDLAADSSGGVYLTGSTYGNLGGVYNGGSDAFLRKYSGSGRALWTKQIGSAGDDYGNAIAAYSSSELYLAGEAGGALADTTHRGAQDAFLRRTDGSGNRVWTDQ